MIKFEKISKFADVDFDMPVRKTKHSAGYDMVVAEDTVVPPLADLQTILSLENKEKNPVTLDEMAALTKATQAKPTLVPTGVKCYLDEGCYLELSVRSSSPLKYLLVLANSVGIIDSDYADNKDNEGHIFFQLINLSPFPIVLRKNDIIGQGIIHKYCVTDDDAAAGERTGGFGSTTNA